MTKNVLLLVPCTMNSWQQPGNTTKDTTVLQNKVIHLDFEMSHVYFIIRILSIMIKLHMKKDATSINPTHGI